MRQLYCFEHETDIVDSEGLSIPVYVEAVDSENFGVFVMATPSHPNLESVKVPVDFEKLPLQDQKKIKENIGEHFFMEDASDDWSRHSMTDLLDVLEKSCTELDELNSIRKNK